jgi:hypothetical protein
VKYTVVWNAQPTESIDAAWDEASSEGRERLYKATEAIHESLSTNPFAASESREYAIDRVVIASPLTVFYRIDRATSQVRVYAAVVWRTA